MPDLYIFSTHSAAPCHAPPAAPHSKI
jgi:hypothetical protein